MRLAKLIGSLPDAQIKNTLFGGPLDRLIDAIMPRRSEGSKLSIYEYFLAHRNRAHVIALLRQGLLERYSIARTVASGETVHIFPLAVQWFDDGIMIHQGPKKGEGPIALYRNGVLTYAIAARDIGPGGSIGPTDLMFVTPEEIRAQAKALPATSSLSVASVNTLKRLLASNESSEAKYQSHLAANPWMLGSEYKTIEDHKKLDDENIPDFTAVRVADNFHDVVEIKAPTLTLFTQAGELSSEFNAAWNQAERYLDFMRQQRHYLADQKGIKVHNPTCTLLIGNNLSTENWTKVHVKERANPLIRVMTYDQLVIVAEHILKLHSELAKK